MHERFPQNPKEQVSFELKYMQEQILRMGASDSEPSLARHIIETFERGEIEPQEAKRRMRELFDSKNPYH